MDDKLLNVDMFVNSNGHNFWNTEIVEGFL